MCVYTWILYILYVHIHKGVKYKIDNHDQEEFSRNARLVYSLKFNVIHHANRIKGKII